MTIEEIALSWFRGAGKRISLPCAGKNVVVYGPNGSGKSCFVDGLEFILADGKIRHLSHEYSGKRLEKAVLNTHAPSGALSRVEIRLCDGTEVAVSVSANGLTNFTHREVISDWSCGRVILRQDAVAEFVHSKKGEKYSVLLPLIGLDPLENIAANIAATAKKVRDESSLDRMEGELQELHRQWTAAFPGMDTPAVGNVVKQLYAKYVRGSEPPKNFKEAVDALKSVIEDIVSGLTAEQARHLKLQAAHQADMAGHLAEALAASEEAAGFSEPLLAERLQVLTAAENYGAKIDSASSGPCPACGREIQAAEFQAHVRAEAKRLRKALDAFDKRKTAFGKLADALTVVKQSLAAPELVSWLEDSAQEDVRTHIETLVTFDLQRLRSGPTPQELATLVEAIGPVARRLKVLAEKTPRSAEELFKDLKVVEAAASHPRIRELRAKVKGIKGLLHFLGEVEAQTRTEIKERTKAVIAEISKDMQAMWAQLHPNEPIDDVRLYQPADEKAIDIALRFHGKEQPSPRLTLSEGHRNSLGLCVFFALAKRDKPNRPLILDDVVTSFDREHRAFVADLLMKEFSGNQVIVLTHDYEWYVELRTRLPGNAWAFKVLLPWHSPTVGIRWSSTSLGFDSARAKLSDDAPSAANKARALMDVQMQVIAERLQLPVPFRRGAGNDARHALDLLQRFEGRASKKLKKRNESGSYEKWNEPVEGAEAVCKLLVPYGNAGSHGRYVTPQEAERLIETCEAFLETLTCKRCGTHLWHAAEGEAHLRCDCGDLRWEL